MTAPIHPRPVALSLSKPVLSDAAGGVEGDMGHGCFDRLSTNGADVATVASGFPNGR